MKRSKPDEDQILDLLQDEETPTEAPGTKKSKVRGIYLSTSDRERAERAAGELGLKLNSLLKFAVRFFLQEYEAGRIKFETEEKIKIPE